jgi:PHP family Zn ribbon phosphoesterase
MNEEMKFPETFEQFIKEYGFKDNEEVYTNGSDLIQIYRVKQWLEHQMTVEEYRQRMIQAFHNADCDELIAVCVLPTEKEFEHLEWLLKNHYKKDPCEDAISRQAAIDAANKVIERDTSGNNDVVNAMIAWSAYIKSLPPVNPQPKTGHWIRMKSYEKWGCSECNTVFRFTFKEHDYCPKCGTQMVEPQESETI